MTLREERVFPSFSFAVLNNFFLCLYRALRWRRPYFQEHQLPVPSVRHRGGGAAKSTFAIFFTVVNKYFLPDVSIYLILIRHLVSAQVLFFNTSASRTPNNLRGASSIREVSMYSEDESPSTFLDSPLREIDQRLEKRKADRRLPLISNLWRPLNLPGIAHRIHECRPLLARETGPLFGEIRTSSCHARLPDLTAIGQSTT